MESGSSLHPADPVGSRSVYTCLVRRGLLAALAAFGCLFYGGSELRADDVDGAWSAVHDWPLIAIHAALTPDGRVLSYGTDGAGKQTGYFIYDIWDPAAGLAAGHMTLQNMTLTDIFCSSQVILPQSGEILISGGDNWTGTRTTNTGNNNSNLFDFGDNSLARSTNMNRARWYSSATVLVNGDIYVQGGSGGADRPEVRQADGVFRLLNGAATNGYGALFPRNFLAPDGRIFGYDTGGKMYFVDPDDSGSLSSLGQFPSSNAGWTSSAAMFRPGRILQIGGNSNGAAVIDINGPQPVVTQTQPMSSQRQWVSATVLADGKVLATGGSEVQNKLIGVNNAAEIWDPVSGQWHVGAAGVPARLYHSSALLLPDATVLVAGGGAPGPQINTNAEIYTPPYLFDSSGELAARPAIVSAPSVANVGDTLTVEVDAAISRVTLVKTGSVTHSVNMDQRFAELTFTASGNMLNVFLPERASDTPPGYYLLFAFDQHGVPSVGNMLRINVDPSPNTAVDYTPTIGGAGGSEYTLACDNDKVLAGIFGTHGTYVNQLGPQCVRMDQLGRWIGDPVNGESTGGTTQGTDFVRTCPRDHAVSGFRGRAGQFLNQLDIECRRLTAMGGLEGAGQFPGPAGGAGGAGEGLLRCGTNNPAYALYGRSGSWLDSVGLKCRRGVITPISLNSEPVVVNPGPQADTVGLPVNLQIEASDSDGDPLTFAASGLPPGLQISAATGRITGSPTVDGLYAVEVSVSDNTDTDTAFFDWDVAVAPPLVVGQMPPAPAVMTDETVTYNAVSQGGVNVVYSWDFGDGSPPTAYSGSPAVDHVFESAGVHYITLTVTDDFGIPQIQTFSQRVHLPLTEGKPAVSSQLAYQSRLIGSDRLWVVNQDNDSVTVIDVSTNAAVGEIAVGQSPRAAAITPNGDVWVTNRDSADITVINPVGLVASQTIALPYASGPHGLAVSPTANAVYVVLESLGRVLKLDPATGQVLGSANVGNAPRHIALSADGAVAYVSRFVTPLQPGEETASPQSQLDGVETGGEVVIIDTNTMTVLQTIVLAHSTVPDAENQGGGVPNYLGPVAVSPDGHTAWVPSKQDNIGRGSLRNGSNLNFQNTVRAVSSRIDLDGGTADPGQRIDHDNSSVASAAASDPLGIYLFVTQETSREVAVVDMHGGTELFRLDTGRAPQGVLLSPDGSRLFVNNFMDRTIDVFDLSDLQDRGQWQAQKLATIATVGSEKLAPEVLRGKQLFYDARDTRLARDRYLSCASCHNDGSGDGRVWDLTGMGEGLRNTISLRGSGTGGARLHWSQNFDEVQDFEGQIRDLAEGTGLMQDADFFAGTRQQPLGDAKTGLSADLDALAAYVLSLDEDTTSPYRNSDGSLTADGVAGRDIFRRENCAACHTGAAFTDSSDNVLHDIGTLKPSSGNRLDGPLTGIDTPTLRGLWSTAPYLHDGAAPTLSDAVSAHEFVSLQAGELADLSAYLLQIDGNEAVAPEPNQPPEIANPGGQASQTGIPVNLAISASDADGDVLTYHAGGLPPGLSIDADDGLISGTPSNTGAYSVVVTVDDGEDSAGVSFAWNVTDPNTPPEVTNPGPQLSETGAPVSLAIVAADADGDVLSFAAAGLPPGLSISVLTGLISGTPSVSGDYSVVISVDDGEDTASASFAWNVTDPNTPPEITNPGPQLSETGTDVSLAMIAADADGDVLTYSAAGLPAGLSVDAGTGIVSGSPTSPGDYNVVVTVEDGEDSADTSFSWHVIDPNTPPQIADPGAQASETGMPVNLAIVASDADGDSLNYAATGLPPGLSIDAGDGLIAGTPTSAATYSVIITVDDGEDSASVSFAWNVTDPNTPPVIIDPGAQASETGVPVSLLISATDADGDPLSYSATGLPPGLSIDAGTGIVSGLPTSPGDYSVVVTVGDGEDSASASFAWTVSDPNTPPEITNPGAQLSEAGTPVSLAIVAADADGDVLSFAATGLPPGLSISVMTGLITGASPVAGDFPVTVTVDDGRASSSVTFRWTIALTNSPPVLGNPGPQESAVGDEVQLEIFSRDPDGDSLTFSATGLPAGLSIDPAAGRISGEPTTVGEYDASVVATDAYHVVSISFRWSVDAANTAPVLSNPGPQQSVVGKWVSRDVDASDADGDPLDFSATGLPAGIEIDPDTGMMSGTPERTDETSVTVSVSDGRSSVSETFRWTVNEVVPAADMTSKGGGAGGFGLTWLWLLLLLRVTAASGRCRGR